MNRYKSLCISRFCAFNVNITFFGVHVLAFDCQKLTDTDSCVQKEYNSINQLKAVNGVIASCPFYNCCVFQVVPD